MGIVHRFKAVVFLIYWGLLRDQESILLCAMITLSPIPVYPEGREVAEGDLRQFILVLVVTIILSGSSGPLRLRLAVAWRHLDTDWSESR